jgi:NAD(P)-dependent dehydrogenase (short-subunit alcohol dehydrogenase family)
MGTAADVAEAVLFAMSNSFLTGVTLAVDGGEALT